jgi:two-component system, chemotaxis family, CheB/CheR fusion protein
MSDSARNSSGAFQARIAHQAIMSGNLVEETLRENAQRLVQLIDALPQLVWTVGNDGTMSYCNAELCSLVADCDGRRVEEVMAQLLHPDDYPRWLAAWNGALKGNGESYELEYRVCSAGDPTAHWYLERAVCSNVASAHWFVTATQIDAPRRREEELRVMLHEKEQFFATLLHELRNPLAPIANAIELLARRGDDPASVSGARGIIQRQLRQLSRLVDDLLDVSRISRGRIELRKEPTDLAEVVATAVETARPLIELRGHHLTTGVPNAPLIVHADAVRLGQVVTNLLINAAKYTNPGGHVSVMLELGADCATIRVRDDGIGISRELLPRVFDLFSQAAPGSEAGMGGMGVGLAVARELIQLHDGSITVQSEGPGRGSEFVMRLPLPDRRGRNS